MSQSTLFAPAPKPANRLARYRALAPTASVHVSPLQLGAMSIGDKWEKHGMGSMDKESSFKLLDAYYEAGGNFIDTANNYQSESSEEFIGEWAESRGIRDELVIATKYTSNFKDEDPSVRNKANYTGNNAKSLYISVQKSLKKLRTSYIDILYVHWWDWETTIEEVMSNLHHLVQQRLVLYLGVSDAPAWVVAKANQWARDHGKTPFVVYQGAWSILERSFEREIIPMARDERMALAPYNVLAGGKLRSDADEERRRQTGEQGRQLYGMPWERNEVQRQVSSVLEKIAKEVGTEHITAVAIAYVLHKATHVFPIIGGRKVEHLQANIDALKIRLTPEHIKELESAVPFDLGFPGTRWGTGTDYNFLMKSAAWFEKQPLLQPISPAVD